MVVTLYHGSEARIERPVFGVGNPANDYGLGFYCTLDRDLACEWAVVEYRSGFANRYELETDGLTILDLNAPEYCTLNWLAVLLENREFDMKYPQQRMAAEYLKQNFRVAYDKADVIVGYRADDSYFSFAKDFLNNTLSYPQLQRAMKLGSLGNQFVLKSPRAFERLAFREAVAAKWDEWYPPKKQRDDDARTRYRQMRQTFDPKDLTMVDILREGLKHGDPKLS